MTSPYTILVNSSDGYEDCWVPFFTLLQKYWPQNKAPIYLNTGHKDWQAPNLDVICTRVEAAANRRLTWSECLISALDQIQSPLVLYFQEDYFIQSPVRTEVIDKAVLHMLDNPEIKHIALTQHCSYGPYEAYSDAGFQRIRQKARYRISTQAALWRVETLKSYLCQQENGWMFEIFGTWRAHKRNDCFLSAKYDVEKDGPAIDYLHTGIIKGKWLRAIEPVFANNGIIVDLNKRGYYIPKHPILHKIEVIKKLLENPLHLMDQLGGK